MRTPLQSHSVEARSDELKAAEGFSPRMKPSRETHCGAAIEFIHSSAQPSLCDVTCFRFHRGLKSTIRAFHRSAMVGLPLYE